MFQCEYNYFADNAGQCYPCDSSCQACNGPAPSDCTVCLPTNLRIPGQNNCYTKCPGKYVAYSNLCLLSCPNGFFNNSGTCESCISPCVNCTNPTYCLSCNEGYKLYPYVTVNNCLKICPNAQYRNNNNICLNCDSSCAQCIGPNNTNCIDCFPGQFLYNGKCLATCPYYTYTIKNICYDCDTSCYNCTGSTILDCINCNTGYSYKDPYGICYTKCPNFTQGTLCVNDCPYNYYFDANNFCFVCDPSCFSCFGPSSSECNSCKNFFYNNSCYTECPSGTFANGSECYKCDDSCSACSTTKNNCTSCSLTHPFHYAFDRTCYTKCPVYTFLSNICVNECQVGFIPINNTCTPCDSECLDCFESTKTCTACDFGLFLFNSTCVSSCPSRYFPYEIFCYPCNEACSSCNDTNFCLACKDPLLFLDIEKGLCSSLCRIGTYAFNHTCIPACPLSYYPDTYRNCQKCPDQCLSCSNNSTCTACASGFYALGTDCLKDCPFSYYNILKNMTCGLCNSECLECVGNEISNCTVCNHGKFVLIENNIGQCVDLCPDGYYQ